MKNKPTTQDLMHLLDATFKNTGIDAKNTSNPKDIQKALKIMQNNPAIKSMLNRMGFKC